MEDTYRLVKQNTQRSADKSQENYNKKTYKYALDIGSRVLVKNRVQQGGPGKLQAYFEDKVYTVVSQPN